MTEDGFDDDEMPVMIQCYWRRAVSTLQSSNVAFFFDIRSLVIYQGYGP